jgi:hypothetical protein
MKAVLLNTKNLTAICETTVLENVGVSAYQTHGPQQPVTKIVSRLFKRIYSRTKGESKELGLRTE